MVLICGPVLHFYKLVVFYEVIKLNIGDFGEKVVQGERE